QAGIYAEVYEAASSATATGGALSVAPNGMRVLAAAGVEERLRSVSVTTGTAYFENQSGKVLATAKNHDAERYGHAGIMITRPALHQTLVEFAEAEGIDVHFNKRLINVEDRPGQPVIATFADGSTATGDCLVGADGIRSQVRQSVMPESPKPAYTGMMAPGGISPCLDANVSVRSVQPVHFIFGQKGFFGYFNAMTEDGPRTLWWSTYAAPLEDREAIQSISKTDLLERLLRLHDGWASPIPELIASAEGVFNLPIHDMQGLSSWTAGRVLLIGDAAHAVAPHSGQGASMALEDAQMLARLMRDRHGMPFEEIGQAFETIRRPRADKVIALGRRNGQRKEMQSPGAYWIMQQMVRIFVPLTFARSQEWLLSYRVEDAV
ncbi:MAG TPA: NAD(P)/FAD-dependent oxidoreductase, partial [Acidobacteriaceae bacterium]